MHGDQRITLKCALKNQIQYISGWILCYCSVFSVISEKEVISVCLWYGRLFLRIHKHTWALDCALNFFWPMGLLFIEEEECRHTTTRDFTLEFMDDGQMGIFNLLWKLFIVKILICKDHGQAKRTNKHCLAKRKHMAN